MSAASQPAWKPPDSDRQNAGWAPPSSDRDNRAAPEEQPKTWLDQLTDVPKGFWNNLKQSGQGIVDTLQHPIETAKGMGASQDAVRLKAENAFKRGDYAEGVRHVLGYLIPVAGPSIDASGDKAQQGKVGEAAGEALSTGLQMVAPGAMQHPAVIPAVETAGTALKGAVKGAAKAAIEPVQYGHLRLPVPAPIAGGAAGGYAAGQLGLPHEAGAVVGAAVPIVRGAVRGAKTALAERAATPAAAAEAAVRTPGQVLAESAGQEWGALSAEEQAMLEKVAAAQANAASQPPTPAPVPSAAAPETPAPAPETKPAIPETPPPAAETPAPKQAAAPAADAEQAAYAEQNKHMEDLLEASIARAKQARSPEATTAPQTHAQKMQHLTDKLNEILKMVGGETPEQAAAAKAATAEAESVNVQNLLQQSIEAAKAARSAK